MKLRVERESIKARDGKEGKGGRKGKKGKGKKE